MPGQEMGPDLTRYSYFCNGRAIWEPRVNVIIRMIRFTNMQMFMRKWLAAAAASSLAWLKFHLSAGHRHLVTS